MATITGTLLIEGEDYQTAVSAVDVQANGSQIYVVYIDASGNLKAGTKSLVQNVDQTLPAAMSGCTII